MKLTYSFLRYLVKKFKSIQVTKTVTSYSYSYKLQLQVTVTSFFISETDVKMAKETKKTYSYTSK